MRWQAYITVVRSRPNARPMSFMFNLSTTCATYIATCLTRDTPRLERPGLRISLLDTLNNAAVISIMPSQSPRANSSLGPAGGLSKIVSVMPRQDEPWTSEWTAALVDVSCTELVPLAVIGISSYIGMCCMCEQTKNNQASENLTND